MELTRRSFLEVAASTPWLRASRGTARSGCLVIETADCLQESCRGYVQAGGAASVSVTALSTTSAATWIVPAGSIDRALAHRLRDAAWSGMSVLVELGVAFMDAPRGLIQRQLLADTFDLAVGDVRHLWVDGRSRIPYVQYGWPVSAWVRDFSRVVALGGPGWTPIAHMDSHPVGVGRRVGRGALTMLGSPLGPALRAGDNEAGTWLRAFLERDEPIDAQNG